MNHRRFEKRSEKNEPEIDETPAGPARRRQKAAASILGLVAVLGVLAAACSSSPTSNASSPASGSTSSSPSAGNPASSSSNPTVKVLDDPTLGKVLEDSAGKALYTYGPDTGHGGQATCTGGCLAAWPALTVPAGTTPTAGSGVTGTLAAVKQANGTYQVTYNGMPIYTFVSDSMGQVTGNGVNSFSAATVSSNGSGSGSGSGAGSAATTTTSSSGGYGGY
jgi:predicted lipoprotein with Yx(FWY)xxD motif